METGIAVTCKQWTKQGSQIPDTTTSTKISTKPEKSTLAARNNSQW